jgi:hypothetical protein
MFFLPCGHTSKQASKQTIYVYWTLLYEKENNIEKRDKYKEEK